LSQVDGAGYLRVVDRKKDMVSQGVWWLMHK
jgi:hypothetical protein